MIETIFEGDEMTAQFVMLCYWISSNNEPEVVVSRAVFKVCHNNGLMIQILPVINIQHDKTYFYARYTISSASPPAWWRVCKWVFLTITGHVSPWRTWRGNFRFRWRGCVGVKIDVFHWDWNKHCYCCDMWLLWPLHTWRAENWYVTCQVSNISGSNVLDMTILTFSLTMKSCIETEGGNV